MRERPQRHYNEDNCITNCVWCCVPPLILLECIFKCCSIFYWSNNNKSNKKVKDNI